MRFERTAGLVALIAMGCGRLPEVQERTDEIELAHAFDAPVCGGTLAELDRHVRFVEDRVGKTSDKIRVYWLDDVSEFCDEGVRGCFYPGTKMAVAQAEAITHEIVHAVIDVDQANVFAEEGMAELLSGRGIIHDPRLHEQTWAEMMRAHENDSETLDYGAAGHWAAWLEHEKGSSGTTRMLETIGAGGDASAVLDATQALFANPLASVESEYRASAPWWMEGLAEGRLRHLTIGTLRRGIAIDLDCEGTQTLGPLVDGEPGMYRTFIVKPSVDTTLQLSVAGPTEGLLAIFRTDGAARRGEVVDWLFPDPELDPEALEIPAGGSATITFEGGEVYRLRLLSHSFEPARFDLVAFEVPLLR